MNSKPAPVKRKMAEQPVILDAISCFLKHKGIANLNIKELYEYI